MPFAGGIVGEHHIAGLEHSLNGVAGFDLPGAGQGHEELTAGRRVAIDNESRWGAAENRAGGGARVGCEHRLIAAEFQLDFFKV